MQQNGNLTVTNRFFPSYNNDNFTHGGEKMSGKKPIVISGTKAYPLYSSSMEKGKKGGCGCGKPIKKK
ncbi:hypothetical protein GCM10008982_27790 [Anoxybacillus voinovskiensis]|nr:hypothetical protein GCM10008982_27790 [Anoxybacillus voinovskiensis]